jgi:hypothetical protein
MLGRRVRDGASPGIKPSRIAHVCRYHNGACYAAQFRIDESHALSNRVRTLQSNIFGAAHAKLVIAQLKLVFFQTNCQCNPQPYLRRRCTTQYTVSLGVIICVWVSVVFEVYWLRAVAQFQHQHSHLHCRPIVSILRVHWVLDDGLDTSWSHTLTRRTLSYEICTEYIENFRKCAIKDENR